MASKDYQSPVADLLQYGDCGSFSKWPNYVQELGLQEVHIPELIRMATDEGLNQSDSNSLEVWAPTHAWRSLGQLRAKAATEPLLELLETPYDDWIHQELPIVMSMIGPSTIPEIQRYLADQNRDRYGRIAAVTCFRKIQARYPQERERCINILIQQLDKFKENEPALNGFLISGLCDLQASEQAPEIERAFDAKRVDLSIIGDWDEVQVRLGLKTRKEVPLRRFTPTKVLGPLSDVLTPATLGRISEALAPLYPTGTAKRRMSPQGFGSPSKQKRSKKAKKK